MYAVSLLSQVAEFILLGFQDSLWNVKLCEGFHELIPGNVCRVFMSFRVVVPPRASCSSELVSCDPNTFFISAGSEVQLLLNLLQPVMCSQGIL
jgi:hypothetical protein